MFSAPRLRSLAFAALVLLNASAVLAGVRLSVYNGRVSVSASNATIGQILQEWARVGRVDVVNLDRLSGAPLTLELLDMPEAQALDVILRSAGGYIASARSSPSANESSFDRLVVIPVAARVGSDQAPAFSATVSRTDDDDAAGDAEVPAGAMPPSPIQRPRASMQVQPNAMQLMPPPQPAPRQPEVIAAPVATPSAAPTSAGAVSAPGMIAAQPPTRRAVSNPPAPAAVPPSILGTAPSSDR